MPRAFFAKGIALHYGSLITIFYYRVCTFSLSELKNYNVFLTEALPAAGFSPPFGSKLFGIAAGIPVIGRLRRFQKLRCFKAYEKSKSCSAKLQIRC